MATPDPRAMGLQPSLLDTLQGLAQATPHGVQQDLGQVKESVRRDLEHLLNARRRPDELPEPCKRLQRALPVYGLPDLTNFGFWSETGRLVFKRCLETAIADFEPRLDTVRVELLDEERHLTRRVTVRIHGRLKVDPAPQAVTFKYLVEPKTFGFKLERVLHG